MLKSTVTFLLGVSIACMSQAQSQKDWLSVTPADLSPEAVGTRVAEHFVTSPHQYSKNIHYSEAASWYGAFNVARLTHNKELEQKLIRRFDPLLPGGAEVSRVPVMRHVDHEIFGIIPLEIYKSTHDPKYLAMGLSFADRQWEDPRPDGLSFETRFWIDDMYMLTILQLEAYRATGDKKYLQRATLEMTAYLDRLQRPNGLFYHAEDAPYFWSRGNGWVAAGMTELLRDLPEDHPQRARILSGYRSMMAALLRYQAVDGMWRQVIDHDEFWEESSGSAMFAFAMISGVKHGWLDTAIYAPAARRAWIAVAGSVDQNSDLIGVCEGTGKRPDLHLYFERKRRTGDYHGQAPVLWSVMAAIESQQSSTDPLPVKQ